ncbi:MAG: polysaccharide pyruvyl transferase family protein [Endomicrobia bacterium]|nr:polysaccharide pyruvyl transferase family protein [Endomicrobiia bacterium]
MRKILIVGYFGFKNFGDEWLLQVLIKKIKETESYLRQVFVLYNTEKIYKVNNYLTYFPRWHLYYIICSVTLSDTIIFCGGLFQDQTSKLSLLYYLFIFLLAKILKKKVVLLSAEFVITKIPKFVQQIILSLADQIFIRNTIDLGKLKVTVSKSKTDRIKFCPDICLSDFTQAKNYTRTKIDTVGLILKFNMDKNLVEQMCLNLSKFYNLVFIPFHLGQDYRFYLDIINGISHCELRVWDRVENYRNIFSDIDLLIVSRLHGVIISLVLQIPFICISEEEKLIRVVRSYFLRDCVTLEELSKKSFELKDFIINPDFNETVKCKRLVEENLKFLITKNFYNTKFDGVII